LVQRGKFEDAPDRKGLDAIISFDYMGAAEYEFGALPDSLKRIRQLGVDAQTIKVRGTDFILLTSKSSSKEDIKYYIASIKLLADYNTAHKVPTKRGTKLCCFFEPEMVERIKKGCKKKTELVRNWRWSDMNFWWDIRNDWFLYPAQYHESVITALAADKKESKKSFFEKIKSSIMGEW
jgi:hypothetical protein